MHHFMSREVDLNLKENYSHSNTFDSKNVSSRPGAGKPVESQVGDPAHLKRVVDWITGLVWFLAGLAELFVGIRLTARLFGVEPQTLLEEWFFLSSGLFVRPFQVLVDDLPVDGAVLDVPGMIAIFAYALLAWLLVRGLWVLFDRTVSF